MRIVATQYSLKHLAFEIYLSGCVPPHCDGCHNPDLWKFTVGTPYTDWIGHIVDKINDGGNMVKQIWILGGEPLDQNQNMLKHLLNTLAKSTGKSIYLFTRYDLHEVDTEILSVVAAVKTGKYIPQLAHDNYTMAGIKLASTNQRVHLAGVHYDQY